MAHYLGSLGIELARHLYVVHIDVLYPCRRYEAPLWQTKPLMYGSYTFVVDSELLAHLERSRRSIGNTSDHPEGVRLC